MDITQMYFQKCKARYIPLGFRRIRQTYARIVNDVLQTFTFKRYCSGRECTVEFGVFPLCEALKEPDCGHYNLCNFEVPTYYTDWSYDRDSETSIDTCVQHICSYIDRHLLPFFAEANCSATALHRLIALDIHFQNIRQLSLQQKGLEDRARTDWRWDSLLRTEKFYMALKCRQYEYAREASQVIIPNSRPEYKALYQAIIDQLNAGNIAYVENILCQNEQETLKNLEKYRLIPITSFGAT